MSLYADNLALIAKYNPAMHQTIIGDGITGDAIERWPETDNFVIRREGVRLLLHSEFDRVREFERFLKQVEDTDKAVVLFGLGNGQVLVPLHERFPGLEHVIIVEPNVEIFRSFLEKYDFAEIFGIFAKASFIIGKTAEEATAMLEELVLKIDVSEKKISLAASIAYRTLYADYYISLRQGIVGAIRFYRINKNTLEAFRLHWLINGWRNLRHVSPDVGIFRDTFAGRPAVIVSAGPSLQNNVHLLRQLKDRALIIAVGSAMTILESHGIVPHFRIAVDGGVNNRNLFKNVDTAACPLIYGDHFFCEVLDDYKGPKVNMTTFDNYILSKAKIDALPVRTGFSVANTTMYLLMCLRCSPIILMGQDLCYSRGKLHAEGAWDEKIEEKFMDKQIETTDIFGNRVYTTKPFLGMKKTFEDIIAANPEVRFLNASEGGLAIEGAANAVLQDLLDSELTRTFPFEDEIFGIMRDIGEHQLQEKEEKIKAVVEDIEKDIAKIIEYCQRIDEKYQKIYQMVETNIARERVMKETKKLRDLIGKLDKLEYYRCVIKSQFNDSFNIRREAMDYASDDWRRQWTGEIGLLRLEVIEIWEYALRTQALIEDYQGKRKLNIVFE